MFIRAGRRAAMLEFEINVNEMPLGKLSKGAIQKGWGKGRGRRTRGSVYSSIHPSTHFYIHL